ncbi:MAG: hypothetical protein Q9192_005543, partial [Flavoplaca navasiana]
MPPARTLKMYNSGSTLGSHVGAERNEKEKDLGEDTCVPTIDVARDLDDTQRYNIKFQMLDFSRSGDADEQRQMHDTGFRKMSGPKQMQTPDPNPDPLAPSPNSDMSISVRQCPEGDLSTNGPCSSLYQKREMQLGNVNNYKPSAPSRKPILNADAASCLVLSQQLGKDSRQYLNNSISHKPTSTVEFAIQTSTISGRSR